MGVNRLWGRVRALASGLKSSIEGSWRGPFYGQDEVGGWHMLNSLEDGFSRGLNVSRGDVERFGPFYSCVAILAQEMSRIGIEHFSEDSKGEKKKIITRAPARVLRKPNHYQTKSDFMLYLMRSLLTDGNCYAVATRNGKEEVDALYPADPKGMWPYVVDGQVLYRFGDQSTQELSQLETDQWYPARDVLHLRMFCPAHPLIGESPITAAMYPAITGMQINKQTAHFFKNMSRPSGILRYPKKIHSDDSLAEIAIQRIKKRFMEITKQGHIGEPLVLQGGADWKPMTMSAIDAELIQSFRLTERQIAQVYRIPSFLLGDQDKTTLPNVESLSRFFLNSSLGWYVDHFEDALTSFFNLPMNETISFDVDTAMLRGDFESRMAAYAKGIQSGVYAINEARKREGLPPQKYGEKSRVQQQLVPLKFGEEMRPNQATEPVDKGADDETAAYIARMAIEKAMRAT